MKNFPRFIATVSVLFVVGVGSVGAFEFVTTRGIGMGKTVLISQPSATTFLLLPSSSIVPGEWIIELGGMREFELSELDRAYVAVATRYKNFTMAIGASQLGKLDYYSEKTGKISISYHWYDYTVSANISGIQYYFGGNYDEQRAGTAGLGFSYSYGRFHFGIAADNLNSPKLIETAPSINPQYSFFGELIGKGAYSVTARATIESEQAVQLALGQKVDVSSRGSIFWGVNTEPFQIGGGLDIWYSPKGLVTYAGCYHPVLGFSHNLSLIYHFGRVVKPGRTFD
jgi:hypothetical protein